MLLRWPQRESQGNAGVPSPRSDSRLVLDTQRIHVVSNGRTHRSPCFQATRDDTRVLGFKRFVVAGVIWLELRW